jgi:hypothetical protein
MLCAPKPGVTPKSPPPRTATASETIPGRLPLTGVLAVDGFGAGDHRADVGQLRRFEEVRGAQLLVALARLDVQ